MSVSRGLIGLSIPVLAGALLLGGGTTAQAGSLAPELKQALLYAGPDDLVPVVVMMEEYPNRDELLGEVRGLTRENQ